MTLKEKSVELLFFVTKADKPKETDMERKRNTRTHNTQRTGRQIDRWTDWTRQDRPRQHKDRTDYDLGRQSETWTDRQTDKRKDGRTDRWTHADRHRQQAHMETRPANKQDRTETRYIDTRRQANTEV